MSCPARRTRENTGGSDVTLPSSQVSPLPPGSVFPKQLVSVGPAELHCKQQEGGSLESLFAKVNQSGKEECKEEFMLVGGVLHRRWTGRVTKEDGRGVDVVQVVVPSEYREALMQLVHEGPWRVISESGRLCRDCSVTFGGLVWLGR